jgi:hypothetical protein
MYIMPSLILKSDTILLHLKFSKHSRIMKAGFTKTVHLWARFVILVEIHACGPDSSFCVWESPKEKGFEIYISFCLLSYKNNSIQIQLSILQE